MIKSNFYIERLVVEKLGRFVYDEEFHKGINVIRGEHSVGKTTILELIFYVLGGEIKANQWLHPADKCDSVICQLNINGKTFTLKRAIEVGKIPDISMFSNDMNAALESVLGWKHFGPRRTEKRASFSECMFELLGWESSKSEEYANLTMHQLLRFLYADQETSSFKLFRAEDNKRADSDTMRIAVAEFLLGLDNLDTHQLRQELLMADREFESIKSELSAIYKILGKDSGLTLDSMQTEIVKNNEEIILLREQKFESVSNDNLEKERASKYKRVEDEINLISRKLKSFKDDLGTVVGEIVDCELYAESLEFRKKSLLESQALYNSLGEISFDKCPVCLEKVEPVEQGHCSLCKCELKEEESDNYLELLTELNFQIKSNSTVMANYLDQKEGLEAIIEITVGELKEAQSRLVEVAKVVDLTQSQREDNARKIGFLEAQNENSKNKINIIKSLDAKKSRKTALIEKIADLKQKIEDATLSNQRRSNNVYNGLSKSIVNILNSEKREDGSPYEESFLSSGVNDVEIDFAKDRLLLDGRVKFSASSNFIKKNTFHISTLLRSLQDNAYRLPRFLMLDSIENGGMKPFRSHQFQKKIIELFSQIEGDFQLIFCTSMVLDDLNNDKYGVGPYYLDNVIKLK